MRKRTAPPGRLLVPALILAFLAAVPHLAPSGQVKPKPKTLKGTVAGMPHETVEIIGPRITVDLTAKEIVAANDDGVAFLFKLFRDYAPVEAGRYLYKGNRYTASLREYALYQAVVVLRDQDWVKMVQFLVKDGKVHIL